MATQTFEITEKAQLTIVECLGNLTLKGDDTKVVTIKTAGEPAELSVSQEGDRLTVRARTDCQIVCPPDAVVHIETVRGDLKVRDLHGDLTVTSVSGDASLREVGPTTIQSVAGDLRARNVSGNLSVQSVAGDARIDVVSGETTLASVGSDLKAEGLSQGLTARSVGSDVRLEPPFTAGMEYTVRAGSDLVIRLPEEANVRFELRAGGGVRTTIADLELHQEGGMFTGVLGEGEALIEAQVGGRVLIKRYGVEGDYDQDFDFDFNIDLSFLDALNDLGPMIEARVAQAMAGLEAGLQEGLRYIDGDRIRMHIERAAEHAQRAAERVAEEARRAAEREAEHARRVAEREAERARMRAEHAERRWQRASGYPTPPTPPTPPMPPTSPTPPTPPEAPAVPAPTADELREERLHVLRMVQEGTLTPEDAAKLLAALH